MKKTLILIIATIFISCTNNSTESTSNSTESKIENLLVPNYKNRLSYKTGDLNEGKAVMGYINDSPQAAFWIKHNIIYAANGSAKAWTNNKIDYAPKGIDFFSVQKAVE